MISFTVQASPESIKTLKRLERETPRIMSSAFGRAATASLRMLVSTVKSGGGRNGVAAFPAKCGFTREMERIEGRPSNWFGRVGVRHALNRWRSNGEQKIGFIDSISGWAEGVQSAARHEITRSQASYFRARGAVDVPTFYDRPAREIIDPFADYLRAGKYAEIVASAAQKILDGKSKAWDGRSRASSGSSSGQKMQAGGSKGRGYYDHKNLRYV